MLLCPNGLITIAAVVAEGNFGGGVRCCFDEDGARPEAGGSKMGRRGVYTLCFLKCAQVIVN